MNNTYPIHQNLMAFGIPLAMFLGLVWLMRVALPAGDDLMSLAITIDLVLTVPLTYFLIIRKTNIPKTTVMPIVVIGLLLGLYFLPKDAQNYLLLFKAWVLPLLELALLGFIVVKVRSAIKIYKSKKGISPDFFTALKDACREIVPAPAVMPFATEVAVMYYGFINWKSRTLAENEFSYHQKSGAVALFGAVVFIIGIETVALHLIIAKWSETTAWVLSILGGYTGIQMLGAAKSLSQRPIIINEDTIVLRYGILNEVEVLLSEIASIELTTKSLPEDEKGVRNISPLGNMANHNTIIRLHNEHTLVGMYGLKKKAKTITLFIDEAARFKQEVGK